MQPQLRIRPQVELLEDRWAPALTIIQNGMGDLSITGTLVNPGNTLTLDQVNPNEISVEDGGVGLGTYLNVGNLTVNLGNHAAPVTIELDLMGFGFGGSVSLTSGNNIGVPSTTFDINGAAGSSIGGNFSMTGGNGADSASVEGDIDIFGNLTANFNASSDSFTLDAGAGVVQGNMQVTNTQLFTLDKDVNGLLTFNSSGEILPGTVTLNSTIGGIAVFSLGAGSDTVTLGAASNILGTSAVFTLGNGANDFTQDAASVIAGNATLTAGSGDDDVTLNGTILGNLYGSMGNGSAATGNVFTLSASSVVLGSQITYNGGNGRDAVTFAGSAVGAYLRAYLGNGADRFDLDSNALGGAYIDGGFGTDVFDSTVVINFPLTLRNFP